MAIGIFLAVGMSVSNALAETIVTEQEETQEFRGYWFTITPDEDGIIAFAVGNNNAAYAVIHTDLNNPPPNSENEDWRGFLAMRNSLFGGWYYRNSEEFIKLPWLNTAKGFDNYHYAFLWMSTSGDSPLEANTIYDGFVGITLQMESPFAAYTIDGNTISGETTSPVPVPGAALLLGSGLLGIVCIMRRKI